MVNNYGRWNQQYLLYIINKILCKIDDLLMFFCHFFFLIVLLLHAPCEIIKDLDIAKVIKDQREEVMISRLKMGKKKTKKQRGNQAT